MKTGDYIMQTRQDDTTYALVLNRLKNGAYEVVAYDGWRNRAYSASTKGWYPSPVIIDKINVPEKAINKIERHLITLSNR